MMSSLHLGSVASAPPAAAAPAGPASPDKLLTREQEATKRFALQAKAAAAAKTGGSEATSPNAADGKRLGWGQTPRRMGYTPRSTIVVTPDGKRRIYMRKLKVEKAVEVMLKELAEVRMYASYASSGR